MRLTVDFDRVDFAVLSFHVFFGPSFQYFSCWSGVRGLLVASPEFLLVCWRVVHFCVGVMPFASILCWLLVVANGIIRVDQLWQFQRFCLFQKHFGCFNLLAVSKNAVKLVMIRVLAVSKGFVCFNIWLFQRFLAVSKTQVSGKTDQLKKSGNHTTPTAF